MIELYLSSDGKHTVHVSADTPEQIAVLAPKAHALYQSVLATFGTKAQMWQQAINGNGHATTIHAAPVVKPTEAGAPRCTVHPTVVMLRRQGRFGAFWSCPVREADGRWCRHTEEVNAVPNGPSKVA